ncbi:MAG: thioredoxin domain-containing protein, partial [Flammeovirgaceae bacterium]|nr:thioredoxin domain-containing protein [Flammeovirgaceae bacterium]
MSFKKPNRLIHATSPYLLQHAYNPVEWFPWGEDALQKAKTESKPILVSIGYSSCHWCHVMEHQSFENEEIAHLMNDFFVCIKVDREERPDIDQIYMNAVQMMGINGGWPLNVFLTPDQKPFFGGTYFHPQAWSQVLININKAFKNNRDQIEQTAEELRSILAGSDIKRFLQPIDQKELQHALNLSYSKLESTFDQNRGGLEKAPKFIMPSIWQWLLRYHLITKNKKALDHAIFTLTKILEGGIYDQVGGGFARYSVDAEWFVPHFEKMLYDNAQLLSLYSEAYCLTKKEIFKEAVYETFAWLQREMTHPDGGFYSALDADSEGVEGKFYCWTRKELESTLGETGEIVADYFQTTPSGNWE